MQLILLSGGSGKRLWPLSNEIRSKQFLKLLKDPDGRPESMVQRVYRQFRAVCPSDRILIATSREQAAPLKNQLPQDVQLLIEPERRDTFPAILLACSYLHSQGGMALSDPVVIIPVDPYTELSYFLRLKKMEEAVKNGAADLVLLGITPTYPSQKYGYILPEPGGSPDGLRKVRCFREKPALADAEQLITQGALWNAGVFASRLGYLLEQAVPYVDTCDFTRLKDAYGSLPKVSFDYAVAEKASSVAMIEYSGIWKDIGTWNTLSEAMTENTVGDCLLNESSAHTHAINELDIPLIVLGAKDMLIAAGPDGILVSDKRESSFLKPYVEQLGCRPRYVERSWGQYKVLDYALLPNGSASLTRKFTILPGRATDLHPCSHSHKTWTFLSGKGSAEINGSTRPVAAGDFIDVPEGSRHILRASEQIELLEVQLVKNP